MGYARPDMQRRAARPLPLKVDGRKARALRTRERILDALLELIDGGNPAPTAAQIAHRAKVAVRSIAQHFRTREHLLLAAAEAHLGRLSPHAVPDVAGPFAERLERFVLARTEVLETSSSMRFAAVLGAPSSKVVSHALQKVAQQRRDELRAVFAAELAHAARWAAPAAEAVTSGAFWDELRHEQKLPRTAATEAMLQALKAVLTSPRGG